MSGQFGVGIFQGHIFRPFKYLDHSLVLVDLYDTSDLVFPAVYDELYDLVKEGVLHAFQSDERSVDAA